MPRTLANSSKHKNQSFPLQAWTRQWGKETWKNTSVTPHSPRTPAALTVCSMQSMPWLPNTSASPRASAPRTGVGTGTHWLSLEQRWFTGPWGEQTRRFNECQDVGCRPGFLRRSTYLDSSRNGPEPHISECSFQSCTLLWDGKFTTNLQKPPKETLHHKLPGSTHRWEKRTRGERSQCAAAWSLAHVNTSQAPPIC